MNLTMTMTLPNIIRLCVFLISTILVLQCQKTFAAEFDIPLTELNSVKKKYPTRSESQKRRQRSKKLEKHVPLKADNTTGVHESTPSPTSEASSTAQILQSIPASLQKTGISTVTDIDLSNTRISHAPYSYLIAGRRTIIQAVISSNTPIAKIFCYFHATGINHGAAIPMMKLAGTNFTYSATIPALSHDSRGLGYRIYLTDIHGVTTQSPPYDIPLSSTTVAPGWQPDHFNDTLNISIDNNRVILEGFSDPALKQP